MEKRSFVKQLPLLAILILAGFLMLWRLGEAHLTNWDEAWYADVSRTISEKGNILTPTWNGQPFLEKPPLYYWLTAISYKIFGDREFSARFVSAVSGVATVGTLYWFAQKKWGTDAAIASSLILLSTPAFLWRARTGNLDSLLTFFIFFSAVSPRVTGIASGFAFLTKGFIGFLYPSLFQTKKLVFAVVIAGIWFAVSYLINGQQFVQQFFAQQGEKIGVGQFSFDYIVHLKTGLKLWFIVFIPALFYAKKLPFSQFIIVFLILLSFLQEKSTWFLHPVYPFVALICGWFLTRLSKRLVFFVFAVAIFQLVYFRSEYIVPDVASDEAKVAIATREFTNSDDVVYLTHYYFPTAVYYSRRKTYAVYSERPSVSWWILPKSEWSEIFKKDRVFINTSSDDLKDLQHQFPDVRFEIFFQSGSKLLAKKGSQAAH